MKKKPQPEAKLPQAEIGLCAECTHHRILGSRRSQFVRCGLADTNPRFPRYPTVPVQACAGFKPAGGGSKKKGKGKGRRGGGRGGGNG